MIRARSRGRSRGHLGAACYSCSSALVNNGAAGLQRRSLRSLLVGTPAEGDPVPHSLPLTCAPRPSLPLLLCWTSVRLCYTSPHSFPVVLFTEFLRHAVQVSIDPYGVSLYKHTHTPSLASMCGHMWVGFPDDSLLKHRERG